MALLSQMLWLGRKERKKESGSFKGTVQFANARQVFVVPHSWTFLCLRGMSKFTGALPRDLCSRVFPCNMANTP